MTAKAYTFTVNNYTDEHIAKLAACVCKYIVYGQEVAPTTGTPHLQGYVYFDTPVRPTGAKTALGIDTAHIEKAKGNPEQNRTYCTKDGHATERGELPRKGKRTDIQTVKDMVKQGATMRAIIDEAPSYQAMKAAELIIKYAPLTPRDTPPVVLWFHGPTGTGKTRKAHEICPLADTWISHDTLQWFDGYDGQPNVIIDDFRASDCKFKDLLRLLDRYPLKLPIKGGFTEWKPTRIIITSTHHPTEVYANEHIRESINQLLRRITRICDFTDPEFPPDI